MRPGRAQPHPTLVHAHAHALPESLGPTAGKRLVIALRDANRPDVMCGTQHPLSGCATVDWSDALSRPNVPDTGVFDNSIALQLSSGSRRFFLSESLALAAQPDRFDAG